MEKETKKEWFMAAEAKKWRNLAIGITGLGILVFAIPWESSTTKFYVAMPLYIMFVYVYYKYICLRKAAAQEKEELEEREKQSGAKVVEMKDSKRAKKN